MATSWTIIIWMFTLISGRFRKAVGPWLSFEGAGPNKTDSSILEANLGFYVGFNLLGADLEIFMWILQADLKF